MMFGNIVQRKILGLVKDEITAGWKKLHNEELCNLYFSHGIIKSIRMR
jgi:hypothetical protein